nr:MAG TPA: hypothetical protein [Caudoviricetes sp.]
MRPWSSMGATISTSFCLADWEVSRNPARVSPTAVTGSYLPPAPRFSGIPEGKTLSFTTAEIFFPSMVTVCALDTPWRLPSHLRLSTPRGSRIGLSCMIVHILYFSVLVLPMRRRAQLRSFSFEEPALPLPWRGEVAGRLFDAPAPARSARSCAWVRMASVSPWRKVSASFRLRPNSRASSRRAAVCSAACRRLVASASASSACLVFPVSASSRACKVSAVFLFSLARVSQVRACFFHTVASSASPGSGSGSPSSSLPLLSLSPGVSLSRSEACGVAVSAWAASVVPPPAGMSGATVRTQGGIDNALAGIFCILSVLFGHEKTRGLAGRARVVGDVSFKRLRLIPFPNRGCPVPHRNTGRTPQDQTTLGGGACIR